MEMSGETVIRAPRGDVWTALNDPDVLKACIPGCERLEKTSPTDMEADVTQKVGPVKAKFKGAVTLEDIVEGESYRLVGEGKGGTHAIDAPCEPPMVREERSQRWKRLADCSLWR